MAEPVGLALGTVALVSLFSTCVELMEWFELSQNFEHDYERACLKISLLKTRLDTWGGEVFSRYVDGGEPGRGGQMPCQHNWLARDQRIIFDSLEGIQDILGSLDLLKSKYSIKWLPRKSASMESNVPTKLLGSVKSRRLWIPKPNFSRARRSSTWAVRDKQKFDNLIADLDFFITSLEAVSLQLSAASRTTRNLEMANSCTSKSTSTSPLLQMSANTTGKRESNTGEIVSEKIKSTAKKQDIIAPQQGPSFEIEIAEKNAAITQVIEQGSVREVSATASFRVKKITDHASLVQGIYTKDTVRIIIENARGDKKKR